MNVSWDYSDLARSYVKRADYAARAVAGLVERAGPGARACDVGAGAGHLTWRLAERGMRVDAVEPNAPMREQGVQATRRYEGVRWFDGAGEATGRPDGVYDLVSFGSSFNVVDRARALAETRRIAKPRGWFACLWNHRVLEDPLQARIEGVIRNHLPEYDYGLRREDQGAFLEGSGIFEHIDFIQADTVATQSKADVVEAWRSHATLHRQAGERFERIVEDIAAVVGEGAVDVPYVTRMWVARLKA